MWIRSRRKKPRPGRLKGKDLEQLRRQCFERDNECCVVCGMKLRWETGYRDSMHMAHIRAKRIGGDNLANVRSKCFHDHIEVEHLGGKVVPKKVRVDAAGD